MGSTLIYGAGAVHAIYIYIYIWGELLYNSIEFSPLDLGL